LSEALKTNSTLTALDLRSNNIGVNGAKAPAEVLKTNSTLTTLYLEYNSFADTGVEALIEALKSNWTLTTIILRVSASGKYGGPQGQPRSYQFSSRVNLKLSYGYVTEHECLNDCRAYDFEYYIPSPLCARYSA
ncbi:hypothetical protein BGZ83_011490, partial [Gryganskiella cystojenkinii]